jgi:hypothetical protein
MLPARRIFVEPPDIEDGDIGFAGEQPGNFVRRQRGRVPAGLDQFAKGLGVGIDVAKQLKASRPPPLETAVEVPNVRVPQCRETIDRLRNEAFAGVVDHDRHVLAGQPGRGFERDPLSRHVGGKQRMARGKGGLAPQVEKRDFIAQQEFDADLRGRERLSGHRWVLDVGSGIP